MLKRFLARHRDAREQVQRDAAELLLWTPDLAYSTARERSRECGASADPAGNRHWGRVAVEIARRTSKTIGETAADRYAAEPPKVTNARRQEVAESLTEIAAAIADLARGREHDKTLHNAEAAVHRLAANSPEAVQAGRDLRRALSDLATTPADSAAAMATDVYPPRAETAGQALAAFRAAL